MGVKAKDDTIAECGRTAHLSLGRSNKVFFTFLAGRDEQRSVMLSSNFVFFSRPSSFVLNV